MKKFTGSISTYDVKQILTELDEHVMTFLPSGSILVITDKCFGFVDIGQEGLRGTQE
jgi:hypothetical protein